MKSPIRPRVLCVDDDEDTCEMLNTLLRSSRIEATTAATGAQALQLIQAEDFDLYLLDAWLPDFNGVELCRQLRAFDSHTPILFFSGAACESDMQKAMAAGANAYVVKPDVGGLLGNLSRLIAQSECSFIQATPPRTSSERLPAFQL